MQSIVWLCLFRLKMPLSYRGRVKVWFRQPVATLTTGTATKYFLSSTYKTIFRRWQCHSWLNQLLLSVDGQSADGHLLSVEYRSNGQIYLWYCFRVTGYCSICVKLDLCTGLSFNHGYGELEVEALIIHRKKATQNKTYVKSFRASRTCSYDCLNPWQADKYYRLERQQSKEN